MLGNFFFKLLMIFINLIDHKNKKKIIKFFKKKIDKKKEITVVDVGAHKGETIDLFTKNFNACSIYSFEPNKNLFNELLKKYKSKNIKIFNMGMGEKLEQRELKIFKDTSSSTFNNINENTNYFKRKKKIMSLFLPGEIFLKEQQMVKICILSEFFDNEKLYKIDILKIDTEGYELNVLKGINELHFKNIKFIYFEHHYDLMIDKKYKFSDINDLLKKNDFHMRYKLRMKYRKSFEYIYENSK